MVGLPFVLRILVVLFVLGLLAIPATGASSPSPPIEIRLLGEGTPAVGAEVTVLARLQSHAVDDDLRFRLEAPQGVRVVSSPDWSVRVARGGSYEHTWRVVFEREGLWALDVVDVDPTRGSAEKADGATRSVCCLLAWAGTGEGAWGEPWRPLFEAGGVRSTIHAEVTGDDAFSADYTVVPEAAWMRHATLTARVWSPGNGSTNETTTSAGHVLRVHHEGTFMGGTGLTVEGRTEALLAFATASGPPIEQRFEVDCSAYWISTDWKRVLPGGAHGCDERVLGAPTIPSGVLVSMGVALAALIGRRRLA